MLGWHSLAEVVREGSLPRLYLHCLCRTKTGSGEAFPEEFLRKEMLLVGLPFDEEQAMQFWEREGEPCLAGDEVGLDVHGYSSEDDELDMLVDAVSKSTSSLVPLAARVECGVPAKSIADGFGDDESEAVIVVAVVAVAGCEYCWLLFVGVVDAVVVVRCCRCCCCTCCWCRLLLFVGFWLVVYY